MIDLPQYQCHKIVEAAQIMALSDPNGPETYVMVALGGEAKRIDVPPDFFARGRPGHGDYLVKYRNNYLSWSPRQEFEDGYKAL